MRPKLFRELGHIIDVIFQFRLQFQSLREVRLGFRFLSPPEMAVAAPRERNGEIGLQFDGFGEIVERFAIGLNHRQTAIVVVDRIFGIQLDQAIKIGERAVEILQIVSDQATAFAEQLRTGIEPDSHVQIGKTRRWIADLAANLATIVVPDGSLGLRGLRRQSNRRDHSRRSPSANLSTKPTLSRCESRTILHWPGEYDSLRGSR